MLKYLSILLVIYFLYYAGNILYDLFLKKEKISQTDTTEEFSLGDFAENNAQAPNMVGIEDVENINTPNSFLKNQFQSQNAPIEDEPKIEDLRRRFEAEQDIDNATPTDVPSEEIQTETPEKEIYFESEKDDGASANNNEETSRKKNDWKSLLKLSETTVHMIANYDGQKVYHSTL
ncbi:hypothetical protein [Epilithonimonas caeni]|uniref:hypothetical protein n=1 Tax=Epilithonimonas caeni TaxID=365343 RepID=UPI00041BB64C|nr:hypothetical protein [Epilithonimonas caeni]